MQAQGVADVSGECEMGVTPGTRVLACAGQLAWEPPGLCWPLGLRVAFPAGQAGWLMVEGQPQRPSGAGAVPATVSSALCLTCAF